MPEKPTFYTATKRLSDFLQSLKKSQSEPVRAHLAKAQHFDSLDSVEAIIAYAEVVKLARAAKLEVQSMDDVDEDLNIKPIVQIEGLIANLTIDHTGTDVLGQIGESNLVHLQHTAQLLKNPVHERRIPEEELSGLLNKVNELMQDITDSETPAYLKELLIEHLYSLQRAINAYKISGAKGLRNAVERGLGALQLVYDQVKQETGGDEKNSAWKQAKHFYFLMMEGNKLISLAYNIHKTYQIADSFFGSNLLSGD